MFCNIINVFTFLILDSFFIFLSKQNPKLLNSSVTAKPVILRCSTYTCYSDIFTAVFRHTFGAWSSRRWKARIWIVAQILAYLCRQMSFFLRYLSIVFTCIGIFTAVSVLWQIQFSFEFFLSEDWAFGKGRIFLLGGWSSSAVLCVNIWVCACLDEVLTQFLYTYYRLTNEAAMPGEERRCLGLGIWDRSEELRSVADDCLFIGVLVLGRCMSISETKGKINTFVN